jgi:hypothetical protein
MYDICYYLEVLLQPFGNSADPASSRCMLEIFLEKCGVLFTGNSNPAKDKRVPHSHIEKVTQTLTLTLTLTPTLALTLTLTLI